MLLQASNEMDMDATLTGLVVFSLMLHLPFKIATGLNLVYVVANVSRSIVGFKRQSLFCQYACTTAPPYVFRATFPGTCEPGFKMDRLSRCIHEDSELHQLMAPLQTRQELLAVAVAYELGTTPEAVLKEREHRCFCTWQHLGYIPWVLGVVALMAFGCYRREYNQRKRFLLDTQVR